MTVRSELFRGDVAQARAIAGVPVDAETRMLDSGEEGGEVCGVEVGFEVQLDMVRLCDGERALQHIDHCLLLILRHYSGLVDEWQHNAMGSNAGGDRNKFVQRSEEHTSELQSLRH